MKRHIRFYTVLVAIAVWLFALIAALFSYAPPADADGLTYAQIKAEGAVLYRKDGDTYTPVTTLPATYFVCLTGESRDGYLPVGYLDLDGYVLASSVAVVDYEPVYKYAVAPLSLVTDGHTVNLRSLPDHSGDNVVLRLPQTAVLQYYGSTEGSTQVSALGSTWYYVRYETDNAAYYGYVYTLYAQPSLIPDNVIERVPAPPIEEPYENDPYEDPFRPGSAVFIIVIVCMCVSAAAALVFLYRSESRKHKKPINAD